MSRFPRFSTLWGEIWWKRDLLFLEIASFSVVSLCYAKWSYTFEFNWSKTLVTKRGGTCFLSFYFFLLLFSPCAWLQVTGSCPFLMLVGHLVELIQFTKLLDFFFCHSSFVLIQQTASAQRKIKWLLQNVIANMQDAAKVLQLPDWRAGEVKTERSCIYENI